MKQEKTCPFVPTNATKRRKLITPAVRERRYCPWSISVECQTEEGLNSVTPNVGNAFQGGLVEFVDQIFQGIFVTAILADEYDRTSAAGELETTVAALTKHVCP
jgi:hypothetical protein